MKHKISISIDEKTFVQVLEAIRNGKFRNRSHAFEFAINEVMKE